MIAVLALPETLKSFCLEDVTDDPEKLSAAFDIVVDGYSGLSSRTLDPRQVRETVCNDDYHRQGVARTLLLSGWNPETARVEPLGTLRITLGSADTEKLGMRPLEAMNLMTVPDGWANFHFAGFEVNQVVREEEPQLAWLVGGEPENRWGYPVLSFVPWLKEHSGLPREVRQEPIVGNSTFLLWSDGSRLSESR